MKVKGPNFHKMSLSNRYESWICNWTSGHQGLRYHGITNELLLKLGAEPQRRGIKTPTLQLEKSTLCLPVNKCRSVSH